jgi:hypothetical protein
LGNYRFQTAFSLLAEQYLIHVLAPKGIDLHFCVIRQVPWKRIFRRCHSQSFDILLSKHIVAFIAISVDSLPWAQGWMSRGIGIIRFTSFVRFRSQLTCGGFLRGIFFLWKIFGGSAAIAGPLRRVSRIGGLAEHFHSRLFTLSWSEDPAERWSSLNQKFVRGETMAREARRTCF